MRAPPESSRSVGGHLIAHHFLGNVAIGNGAVMTSGVIVLHDGLEVLTRKINLVSCVLPRDGHPVRSNRELAGTLGDHAVDVDFDLRIVNNHVIVVGDDGHILYVDEVGYKLLGGGRWHHGVLGSSGYSGGGGLR